MKGDYVSILFSLSYKSYIQNYLLTFSFSSEIFASKNLSSELSVFKKVVNFEELAATDKHLH